MLHEWRVQVAGWADRALALGARQEAKKLAEDNKQKWWEKLPEKPNCASLF